MKEILKNVFNISRIIPRLIASWFLYVVFLEIVYKNPADLSFASSVSLIRAFAFVFGVFIVSSVVASLLYKVHFDSYYLLVIHTVFTILSLNLISGKSTNVSLLVSLGFLLLYAFTLVYFYKTNKSFIENLYLPKWLTILLIVVFALGSFLICGSIMFFKTRSLSSPNFDYGLFENVFYNIRRTGHPYATCERDELLSHFSIHLSPIFYVIYPIFYIFPYAETLNVIQPFFVALGVLPIALMCFKRGFSNIHTLIISILYLFNLVILSSGNYDFHENSLLIFPLLMLMYFSLNSGVKRYIGMAISAILVLSVKEDAFIYVFVFGIYLLVSERKYIEGLIYMALPVLYFFFALNYINTQGVGAMTSSRYGILIYNEDDGFMGIIKTLFVNPAYAIKELFTTTTGSYSKLMYVLELFIPLVFIPLFIKRPSRLVLLLPIILNLLTEYSYQYDIGFQYHYGIMAYLFFLTILNLDDLADTYRGFLIHISLFITIIMFITSYIPRASYPLSVYMENKDYYEAKIEILESIDKDASVSANTFFIAYLADREEIYETYYHKDRLSVDYVVLNSKDSSDMNLYTYYLNNGYTEISNNYDMIILKK